MRNPHIISMLCWLVSLIVCIPAAAQQQTDAATQDPAVIEARSLLQAGREDIVRDEIRLTASEAAAFWPAYEAYQSDIMVVRDRQANLIANYIEKYRAASVSNDLANALVDDYLDIKSDLLRIQRKHTKRFRKALPPRKAARFYQLENKLDAELDVRLARFVPLMDPV